MHSYLKEDLSGDAPILRSDRSMLTQNSLRRIPQEASKWVHRRVSQATAPETVIITGCCWVPPPVPGSGSTLCVSNSSGATATATSSGGASLLLCGLSDGTLCLVNTLNFSKSYLLEEPSGRAQDDSGKVSGGKVGIGRSSVKPHEDRTATLGSPSSSPSGSEPRRAVLGCDCALPPVIESTAAPPTESKPPQGGRSAVICRGKGLDASASAALPLQPVVLCVVFADGVYTGVVDTQDRLSHRTFTKSRGLQRVTGVPTVLEAEPAERVSLWVQFSEDRHHILVASKEPDAASGYAMTLLAYDASATRLAEKEESRTAAREKSLPMVRYKMIVPWTALPAPSHSSSPSSLRGASRNKPVLVQWWTPLASTGPNSCPPVLVLWAGGEVMLLTPPHPTPSKDHSSSNWRVVGECGVFSHNGTLLGPVHRVNKASATPVSILPSTSTGVLSSLVKPLGGSSTMEISGVLSVVLGENMVQSFLMSMTHTLLCTLQSKPGEFKATKREREDDRCTEETSATTGSEGENTKSTESMTPTHRLILEPTPRPYFSHDIPISDLQFFFNFSPSLAVVLRSGALVLLDLLSMETHVCCAVGRTVDERKQVNPPLPTASVGFGRRGRTSATLVDSKSRTNVGGGISSEPYRAARLRCLVVGKPFNPCLVEKNTISLPERLCERR